MPAPPGGVDGRSSAIFCCAEAVLPCRLAPHPLTATVTLLHAQPAAVLARPGYARPTAAPQIMSFSLSLHLCLQFPCLLLCLVAFFVKNNLQGLTIAVMTLLARLLGRGCVQ